MTTQRLRTVVTLGGMVDSSLSSMTQEFNQATKRMGRETGNLSRQQKRLAERIKKAVLAGKDTSKLSKEYERLTRRIKEAREETDRLAALSERGAKASERLSRSFSQVTYAAGGVGMATAGFSALMTMSNKNTAEMDAIAKGYDMTLEQYKMWDSIGKRMGDGMDGTTIGDLVEELGNKSGELGVSGEMSKYEDALKALSLDPEKVDKMSAYDRFITIMKQLQKVKNNDLAKFAADEIFGGNANRVITYLKNAGVSVDELLKKQKAMNLLTNKGVDGAKKYNNAFAAATSTFGSAWEEVAGIVGGEVAPVLEKVSADFAKWFSDDANKAGLVESFKEVGRQLRDVGGVIVDVAKTTNHVAQAFGGWGNVAYGVAAFLGGKLVFSIGSATAAMFSMAGGLGSVTALAKAAMVAMRGFSLATMATPLGILSAISLAGYAIWENWDFVSKKLMVLWEGLKSAWQSVSGLFTSNGTQTKAIDPYQTNTTDLSGPAFLAAQRINAAAPSAGSQVSNNIGEIKVYTKEGQSPEDFGTAIYERFTAQKFHDFAESY